MKPVRVLIGLYGLVALAGCRQPVEEGEAAVAARPARPIGDPPCIYFKSLRPFLPAKLPGYDQVRDEGSTGKYGDVSVSEAERVFGQGQRELAVRIVDTTLSPKLAEKIKARANADAPTDEATAPIFLAQTVGFVRFDPSEGMAEANLLVGDRFVVAVTGRGYQDTREVRALAGQLDLAGLSKLR